METINNAPSCADANECATNNGGCSQSCTNTVGSYFCSCVAGYALNANRKSCDGKCVLMLNWLLNWHYFNIDVNECASSNGNCSHICTNTIGSYYCSCITGYQLNVDGKTCNGCCIW